MAVKDIMVDGEVYNVRDYYTDQGMPVQDVDAEWYEYRLWILGHDGTVRGEWDSLTETYNGVQQLSQAQATEALTEALTEIKSGNLRDFGF